VGMKGTIGDIAAIEFVSAFYQALGYGRSVQTAFHLGCNAIAILGIPEANTPRLVMRKGVDAAQLLLTRGDCALRSNSPKQETGGAQPAQDAPSQGTNGRSHPSRGEFKVFPLFSRAERRRAVYPRTQPESAHMGHPTAFWPTSVARLGEAVAHSGQIHPSKKWDVRKVHRSRPPTQDTVESRVSQEARLLSGKDGVQPNALPICRPPVPGNVPTRGVLHCGPQMGK
jgi:hypothetical protein